MCTDVMARGVDFPAVDWVIQFDPPLPLLCDPLPVRMVTMKMTYMYIYTSCTNEDH